MTGIDAIVAARHQVDRVVDQLPEDPDLAALLQELQSKYGSAIKVVLLYGSYTRGARDSLVDLYVLLDGYPSSVPRAHAFANKLLPPNVYQLQAANGVRCKYALLPLRQFARRLERDFHSYFWARFAQPVTVLYVSDGVSTATLHTALAAGVRRFLGAAAGAMQAGLTEQYDLHAQPISLWRAGLELTYACELRAEGGGRAAELVQANSDYFAELAAAFLAEQPAGSLAERAKGARLRWALRRGWGKVLSVLRLLKAAFTFNDGFEYLLWKIERHSGIYLEPTPAQRRWPLLLGWPLFWRLYRLGAFR